MPKHTSEAEDNEIKSLGLVKAAEALLKAERISDNLLPLRTKLFGPLRRGCEDIIRLLQPWLLFRYVCTDGNEGLHHLSLFVRG